MTYDDFLILVCPAAVQAQLMADNTLKKGSLQRSKSGFHTERLYLIRDM